MTKRSRTSRSGSRSGNQSGFEAKAVSKALLTLLPTLIVLLIMAWVLLWLSMGDSAPYLGYIHAGGLVFALLALIMAAILLFQRKLLFAALGLLLGGWLVMTPSGLNIAASVERPAGKTVRVLSASLRGLNRDMAGSAKHLMGYDADIIGLQEVDDAKAFLAAVESETGADWYLAAHSNLALVSRYPITSQSSEFAGVLKTVIALPQRPVSVWTLRAPKAFETPYVNRQFFTALRGEISRNAPDAVVGDFNATPWNEGYARISQIMTNAQKQAGLGPGSTFPGPVRRSGLLGAFARIDHVFVSPKLRIDNAATGQAPSGSDHHPVMADIVIR